MSEKIINKRKKGKVSYEDIKELTLIEFLEKRNVPNYVRRAYLKKFNTDDKFTELEWLQK